MARASKELGALVDQFFQGHPVAARNCLLVAYFIFIYVFWLRPLFPKKRR